MLVLLACVAPGSDPPGVPRSEVDDTGPDTAGDTAPDTADDTSQDTDDSVPTSFACPSDMVAIPPESPAWCIDAYEDTVLDGIAASGAGVLPKIGITYEEAVAACAATPALDDAGEVYAMRHLATSGEWADAGDGVVGDGGTAFPWGDAWDDTRCVTPTTAGTTQFDGLQPTGSMATCVSTFGIYDQVGNAWEWTDSGRLLDADAALALFASSGRELAEDTDGVRLVAGDVSTIMIEAAGVQPPTVTRTNDGYLELSASQVQPDPASFFARGYLVAGGPSDPPLAVRLEQTSTDGDAPWRIHVAREYDGRPLPDKRGCAWYTGTNQGCMLTTASLVHLPDFDGTIGFRCVAPPFSR